MNLSQTSLIATLLLTFGGTDVSSFVFPQEQLTSSTSSSSTALWYREDDHRLPGTADAVALNVLGTSLRQCCGEDGDYCSIRNPGKETVCCQVTTRFLEFSKETLGNDLSKPVPEEGFPGLKDGDVGCITVEQWTEAYNAGMAPLLFLEATHEKVLEEVMVDFLNVFAIDYKKAHQRLNDLNNDRERLDKLFP